MSDMLYKRLFSLKNLELAWTRLKTAQNIQYKNYYRNLFLAYEISKDKNLNSLSERLEGHSYSPSKMLRFYIPKPSGLHRPITFLLLDDLIVYQAFTNIIANKFLSKRKMVEGINVFSNLINKDKDKDLFFFKKWQEGYRAFRVAIKSHFIGGAEWVAHFDIAAYYDTISHFTLSEQISKKSYPEFKGLLKDCLREWSTGKRNKVEHGIPQGPIASDLIGEIYLLPIDSFLNKHGIKYVRYVDDIKIYGISREEVLNGVLLLEKECKERGLIPQSKKYEIIKATTIEEAIGKNPSLTLKERSELVTSRRETAKIFTNAFNPDTFDISRLRYILKASPTNRAIFNVVINNLNQHPELVESFCVFLMKYRPNMTIGHEINRKALRRPSHYEYVEGLYWKLLSYFKLRANVKKRLIQRAISMLKSNQANDPLKYGLYTFLASTENALVLKWLDKEKSSVIQAMVIEHISPKIFDSAAYISFVNKMIKRTHYEPALVCIKGLIYRLQIRALGKINKPLKDYSGVLRNTLGQPSNIDSIGEILSKRYKVKYTDKWARLLGSNYNHANTLIFLADKTYYLDRNAWISYTDSFINPAVK